MRTLRHLSAFSLSLFFVACSASPEGAADAQEARGPIGKADAAGSCADDDGGDYCGGPSDGACWCDDACVSYGDCCSDVVAVCEGEPEPAFCGGIAGIPCADGLECVDNPDDGCDPSSGGADCGGICVEPTPPPFCGGIAGILCPDGLECVDNPGDGCDPLNGGADCGGICVEPEPPTTCSPADCGPGPLAPNIECDDGTIGGPACVEQDGDCGWVIVECPEPPPVGPSCEGACGGASDDGCWCDDLCESYGDCCADYGAVCEDSVPCGDLSCASDEVCVTHVTQLGPQHSCAPMGADCDGEATCGCMGDEVCTGIFDACGETDDGGISCGCPVC